MFTLVQKCCSYNFKTFDKKKNNMAVKDIETLKMKKKYVDYRKNDYRGLKGLS